MNKNINGLLKEFYFKGMYQSMIDEQKLSNNLELMNNRRRKCIKYKIPKEVLFK